MYGIDLDADEITNEELRSLNTSMRQKIRRVLFESDDWLRTESGWRRKGAEVAQDAETQTEAIQEQATELQVEAEEAPQEPETPEQPSEETVGEETEEGEPKPKARPRKKAAPKSDAETGSE